MPRLPTRTGACTASYGRIRYRFDDATDLSNLKTVPSTALELLGSSEQISQKIVRHDLRLQVERVEHP